MARLQIRLLGPFEVSLDGVPVTGFETVSARAVLAHLALEPGVDQSRAVLAEMLWPDRPPGAALSNLRHTLSVLRRVLAEDEARPWLTSDRRTIALRVGPDVWVDAVEFQELAATPPDADDCISAWESAVELWRGPFLAGLGVSAGSEWDGWLAITSERFRRELSNMLRALADHFERVADLDAATRYARHLTEVDPWDESGHRRLMRLLARAGRAGEALACFEALTSLLSDELGVEASPATVVLADRIRKGDQRVVGDDAPVTLPDFLESLVRAPSSPFVDRERQLAAVRERFETVVRGTGQVVLVAGESGSGKSRLLEAISDTVVDTPDVLVADGRCNSFGGFGDPYLPFRSILGVLTGDVESALRSGACKRELAVRIWESIPIVARTLSEFGADLLDVLVDLAPLVDRVSQALPGSAQGETLCRQLRAIREASNPGVQQAALFHQVTSVLTRVSASRPLVLLIDDLQWADRGSVALFWHLARRLRGARILLVAAFRPEEIDDSLKQVLADIEVETDAAVVDIPGDRAFVDAYLDVEPNELDAAFWEHVFSLTEGHALFTVELIHAMRDQGELSPDAFGRLRVAGRIDWSRVPARAEAAIGQRILRLPDDVQQDLSAAAIQGDEFTAEIVAATRADPGAIARIAGASGHDQGVIMAVNARRVQGRLVGRYRFRHVLFQRYLYDRVDEADRVRLHEATGRAIEQLFDGDETTPVVELARHFERAHLPEPAIDYVYRAGHRAHLMAAPIEAIGLFERALELLRTQPRSIERDRRELGLLGAIAGQMMAAYGYGAPQAQEIGDRIRVLCSRLEPSPATAVALFGLASWSAVRARYAESQELCATASVVADRLDDLVLRSTARQIRGYTQIWTGDLAAAHDTLTEAERMYDPDLPGWTAYGLTEVAGPVALAWDAFDVALLGYLDDAVAMGRAAIDAARHVGHPLTICHCLAVGGSIVHEVLGDYPGSLAVLDELEQLAGTHHFAFYEAAALLYRGRAAGYMGSLDEGVDLLGIGLDRWDAAGVRAFIGNYAGPRAEFLAGLGRGDEGLELVDPILADTRATGEVVSEFYLRLERSVILSILGRIDEAVAMLRAGVADTGRRNARVYQLQMATLLARLLISRGQPREAIAVLDPLVSWFTQGLETAHLLAARATLRSASAL